MSSTVYQSAFVPDRLCCRACISIASIASSFIRPVGDTDITLADFPSRIATVVRSSKLEKSIPTSTDLLEPRGILIKLGYQADHEPLTTDIRVPKLKKPTIKWALGYAWISNELEGTSTNSPTMQGYLGKHLLLIQLLLQPLTVL